MARRRHQEKGFALLFIVLVVAVVAVAAAALLDIVEVDLLIAGEHRRSAVSEMIAEGAIVEVQADSTKAVLLPNEETAGLTVRYAGLDNAGNFIRDPDSVGAGPTLMDENNSAYVRNNNATSAVFREGYTAELRLLRTGPAPGTGINTANIVVYEVKAQSSVNSGQATTEVYAETYAFGVLRPGVIGQGHAR